MMRRPLRIALAAAGLGLAISALLSGQEPAQRPKRVALLVGVNEYKRRDFIDLKWAENDVDEMGKELDRLGFDRVVTMKGSAAGDLQATRSNIDTQLKALLDDIGKNDLVLVMLTGHGQQLPIKRDDGTMASDGFYCPVDAVVNEPSTMVSLSRLTDETLRKWGGENLVLVDACRDGVVDKDKGISRGIQGKVVALPEGTAILFACASGQRSLERDLLRHGVFTYGVLEALRAFDGTADPLTWGLLVDRVQNSVHKLNPAQRPIYSGNVGRLVLADRVKAGSRPAQSGPMLVPVETVPKSTEIAAAKPSAPNDRTPPSTMDRKAKSPEIETDRPKEIAVALEGTRAGDLRDDNGLKMKLRWCPKGRFRMGSPAGEAERFADEGPVDVTLSRGFWLGQFEVTQAQWQAVMGTTLREQNEKSSSRGINGEGSDHPIYQVDHEESTEFCRRWTDAERRAGRLPSTWSYRLPTEAQWEYACRAGTTTATAFGDRLSSREANFDGVSPYADAEKGPYLEETTAVGRYRPNGWGLCDMHGNVWEWCADGYDGLLSGGVDPTGSASALSRVIRGGGWIGGGGLCRSADRSDFAPAGRSSNLGFRVARVPSGQ